MTDVEPAEPDPGQPICGRRFYHCWCVVPAGEDHDVHVCREECGGSWSGPEGDEEVVTYPHVGAAPGDFVPGSLLDLLVGFDPFPIAVPRGPITFLPPGTELAVDTTPLLPARPPTPELAAMREEVQEKLAQLAEPVELPDRPSYRDHTLNCRIKRGRGERCTPFCNCECHEVPTP